MMAAGQQRLQLMDSGGTFAHILLDNGSTGYVLDHNTAFRFDPHHIISGSPSSSDEPPPESAPFPKRQGAAAAVLLDHALDSSSTSTGSVLGTWLDSRLWSRLPEKLIDRILALLPPLSFLRLRSVCRRWYSLLFSDSFLELCFAVSPPRHCFLLFRPGCWSQGILYNPETRSWSLVPLSFLPPHLAVVSSSEGLLCCISEAAGYKTVIICNPLTRTCIQLPLSLKERFVPTVGLTVDRQRTPRSFNLVVSGDDLISPFAVKNLSTEVFDSVSQTWRMSGGLPRLCNLESAKTTFANGCFYCMNYSPFGVLAYDVSSGCWSKIQAPMRRFLRTPNLVECRGRLVMVAAVEKNRLNVPKSIRIWGLQHPKNVWIELERMPQALYEEFMKVSGERAFFCVGHGNFILITIQECSEMVLYDFYEKVWRWLPRCPFLDAGDQGFMQGFAFNPRLDAAVFP